MQTNTATDLVGNFISFDSQGITQPPSRGCGLFGASFTVAPDPTGITGAGCLSTSPGGTFQAGALPSFGTSIDPFEFLFNTGIQPGPVTSYFEALDFQPQTVTPTPEPATWAILAFGLLGLATVVTRGRRN